MHILTTRMRDNSLRAFTGTDVSECIEKLREFRSKNPSLESGSKQVSIDEVIHVPGTLNLEQLKVVLEVQHVG